MSQALERLKTSLGAGLEMSRGVYENSMETVRTGMSMRLLPGANGGTLGSTNSGPPMALNGNQALGAYDFRSLPDFKKFM
jgi:hypothetical protein